MLNWAKILVIASRLFRAAIYLAIIFIASQMWFVLCGIVAKKIKPEPVVIQPDFVIVSNLGEQSMIIAEMVMTLNSVLFLKNKIKYLDLADCFSKKCLYNIAISDDLAKIEKLAPLGGFAFIPHGDKQVIGDWLVLPGDKIVKAKFFHNCHYIAIRKDVQYSAVALETITKAINYHSHENVLPIADFMTEFDQLNPKSGENCCNKK